MHARAAPCPRERVYPAGPCGWPPPVPVASPRPRRSTPQAWQRRGSGPPTRPLSKVAGPPPEGRGGGWPGGWVGEWMGGWSPRDPPLKEASPRRPRPYRAVRPRPVLRGRVLAAVLRQRVPPAPPPLRHHAAELRCSPAPTGGSRHAREWFDRTHNLSAFMCGVFGANI